MIADFVNNRMSSYFAGGSSSETAAKFTKGELEAIYKGNHYNRDESGAMRKTPPPEAVNLTTAIAKANEAITEILRYCTQRVKVETNTAPATIAEKKPDKGGFDKLADYAMETA